MTISVLRRGTIAAAALSAVLVLPACLPLQLGDPEKSKVDARLTGVWEWREGGTVHLVIFRPYDERTWVVEALSGEAAEGGAIKPSERLTFKAWVTAVKGETFVTLAPLEVVRPLPGEKRKSEYLVARLRLEGNTVTARGIDPDYKNFNGIGTSAELADTIGEHLDDEAMYVKKTIKATKWGEDQGARLQKIREDFSKWK